jgi:hypothetical protein
VKSSAIMIPKQQALLSWDALNSKNKHFSHRRFHTPKYKNKKIV